MAAGHGAQTAAAWPDEGRALASQAIRLAVNLDEELVNLTTYQQAFNASARLIQATKELFDVLTNMI